MLVVFSLTISTRILIAQPPAEDGASSEGAGDKGDAGNAAPQGDAELAKQLKELCSYERPTFKKTLLSPRHDAHVLGLAISDDGSRAVSYAGKPVDGPQRVLGWDLNQPKLLSGYKEASRTVSSVAISADGKYGFCGETGTIHMWKLDTGEAVKQFTGQLGSIRHLACSEDAKYLVSANDKGEVRRWNVETAESKVILKTNAFHLAMDVSRDANVVLVSANNSSYYGWDNTGDAPRELSISSTFKHATFGPDGMIALMTKDGRGLDAAGLTSLKNNLVPGFVLRPDGNFSDLQFTRDGCLITYSPAYPLTFWRLKPGIANEAYKELSTDINAPVTISYDGKTVLYGNSDGQLTMYRLPYLPKTSVELSGPIDKLLRQALSNKKYDELDALAQTMLRENWPSPITGEGPMHSRFYATLGVPAGFSLFGLPLHLRSLRDWIEARPKSQTARLCLSKYYISEAWSARGGGYASSVSESGWRNFREYMDKAITVLQEAEELGDDPQLFAQRFEVAKAQSWERERTLKVLDRLMKTHPTYYPAHQELAQLLMPRWGGEPGELEAYAEKVADQIGGAAGNAVYARICDIIWRFHPPGELFLNCDFDVARVCDGYVEITKTPPHSLLPVELNNACRYAVIHGDRALARKFFEMMDAAGVPKIDQSWPRMSYNDARRWAAFEPVPQEAGAIGVAPWMHIVRYFPNGETLLAVREYHPRSGPEAHLAFCDLESKRKVFAIGPLQFKIHDVAIARDGKKIIAAGDRDNNGIAVVIEFDAEEPLRVVTDFERPVQLVAASPDGKHFAMQTDFGVVHLYDDAIEKAETLELNGSPVGCAFTSDNRFLVTADTAGNFLVHNLEKGITERHKFDVAASPLVALCTAPDKPSIYAADSGGNLYRLSTNGEARKGKRGLMDNLKYLAISPDGRTFATIHHASESHVCVWDAKTGEKRHAFRFTRIPESIAFSRDSKQIAVARNNGTGAITFWNISDK